MEMFCVENKEKRINHMIDNSMKIKGTIVLMKKNVLDFKDAKASLLDRIHELLGKGVSMQLVSSVHPDPAGQHLHNFTFMNYRDPSNP